jgi:hypothetical protein
MTDLREAPTLLEMSSMNSPLKLIALLTLATGPTFITKDATILDWPSTPDGEYRILRNGTGEWTCLPGRPWPSA